MPYIREIQVHAIVSFWVFCIDLFLIVFLFLFFVVVEK